MLAARRIFTSRLWPLLPWIAASVAALALGVYAREAPPTSPDGAPMYPRMPAPPTDVTGLLSRLGVGSVTWFAAASALPLLVWGVRRVDVARSGWRRTLAGAGALFATLVTCTALAQYMITYRGAAVRPGLASYLPMVLPGILLAWMSVAGFVAAIEARRRSVRASLERERLRAEIAEQRLTALTGQLQPHFLFNTLQGISTLIHRDADAADEMLGQLSDLLRDLLQHRDQALVPLGDEMRRARTYLEIARHRFGDRLDYDIDVPASLHTSAVPLFILQPLLENALAHGVGKQLRGGRITLAARRSGERMCVEVADDGAGLAASGQTVERIGLTNTRQRLRAAFGDDQRLTLEPRAGGGAIVRLDLPVRVSPPGRALAPA